MKRVVIAALVLLAVACGSTVPTPAPQTAPQTEHGVASWYGQEFAGRTTANGEIFDPLLLTAAHRSLPFGTIVDVRNPKTNQSVRVRINDRGPYIGNRLIDLSYAAAQQISIVDPGSGDIDMTVVRLGRGDHEPPVPFSVTINNETPAPQQVAAAPTQTVPTTTTVPAPQPVVVDRVQVENRKQVSPNGKSVEIVPLPQPAAPTSVAARQNTATQPPSPVPQPAAVAPAPVPAPVPTHVTTMPAPVPVAITSHAPAPAPVTSTQTPAPAPAPATTTRATSSTPAPAPAPAPATTTPAATPGGRYVVQVGAFSVEENAKILQNRLTKIGLDSHVDHGSLFFVRLGPYATRDEAVQIRTKLENAGISAIVMKP